MRAKKYEDELKHAESLVLSTFLRLNYFFTKFKEVNF